MFDRPWPMNSWLPSMRYAAARRQCAADGHRLGEGEQGNRQRRGRQVLDVVQAEIAEPTTAAGWREAPLPRRSRWPRRPAQKFKPTEDRLPTSMAPIM